LSVQRCTFVDGSKHAVMVALSKLKGLTTLDVSFTEFNRTALEMVADDLPLLQDLDISGTCVDDVNALRRLRRRLRSLTMYSLRLVNEESLAEVLNQLTELQHLDISVESKDANGSDGATNFFDLINGSNLPKMDVDAFITKCDLPNLTSLDLSGRQNLSKDALLSFVKARKDKVRFLGLAGTQVSKDEDVIFYVSEHLEHEQRPLIISGSATENHIVEALRRYEKRPCYVQRSLHNLFKFTQTLSKPRPDLIKVIFCSTKNRDNERMLEIFSFSRLFSLALC